MAEQVIFKAFGNVLKRYRKASGLSQEKLALDTGFDRTFISRMERGLTQPSLSSIFQVAESLEVSASQLVISVEKELDSKKYY